MICKRACAKCGLTGTCMHGGFVYTVEFGVECILHPDTAALIQNCAQQEIYCTPDY